MKKDGGFYKHKGVRHDSEKLHHHPRVERNGKKPRKLKGNVFGADVWKIRTKRRR